MNASVTAKPTRKTGWKIPADFVRAVLKGHSALGLAFAAALYIVCLTGSLAVFARELQRWENPGAPRLEQVSPEAVQAAFAEAVARTKDVEHVYINLPGADLPWLQITTDAKGDDHHWIADENGKLTGEAPSSFSEFLTRLHIYLHLPRTWGIFLVGLTGVALLSSLISGLLAHPRIFRDAFHLRIGGSRRLQEADLHNRLGVWALPFHVTVSLTGALLGLTTIIVGVLGLAMFQGDTAKVYDLFVPPHPKDDPRPAPILDLRPMFAQMQRVAPNGHTEYLMVEHPREQGGAVLFNVADGSNRLSDTDAYTFDRSGKLYFSKKAAANNLGEQILGSLGILHFGWFGGGIVKIAYCLLGLGLTYLAASGVTIWLARRRDKGRPAPRWERVWAATVWSQPLGLTAAGFVGLIGASGTVGMAIAIWGAVTVAMLLAAIRVPAAALSRTGKLATAALLVLLALAHVARVPADPIAWAVDGGLLLAAAALYRFAQPLNRAAAA